MAEALALPDSAQVSVDAVDVVIVGAGIARLSAASAASLAGASVLALEAAPAIGHRDRAQRGHPQRGHRHGAGRVAA